MKRADASGIRVEGGGRFVIVIPRVCLHIGAYRSRVYLHLQNLLGFEVNLMADAIDLVLAHRLTFGRLERHRVFTTIGIITTYRDF